MAALPEDIEYEIQLNLINRKSFSLFQLLYLAQQGVVEALQKKWGLGITGLVKDLVDDYPYVRYTVEWKRYHSPENAYFLALQDGQIEAADKIYETAGNKRSCENPTNAELELILNAEKAGFFGVIDYALTHINDDNANYLRMWRSGYRGEVLAFGKDISALVFGPYFLGAIQAGNVSLVRDLATLYISRLNRLEKNLYASYVLTQPYNPEMYDIVFNNMNIDPENFSSGNSSPIKFVAQSGDVNTIKRLVSDGFVFEYIEWFDANIRLNQYMSVELLEWLETYFVESKVKKGNYLFARRWLSFKSWMTHHSKIIATQVSDVRIIDYLVARGYITYGDYLECVVEDKYARLFPPIILPSLLRHATSDRSELVWITGIYDEVYPNLGDALLS